MLTPRRRQAIKKLILGVVGFIGLIWVLIVSLGLKDKVATLFSEATGTKAEIFVDAASNLGVLPRPWTNLAQGGEEPNTMVKVIDKVKPLKPGYIRLDHIYDFYDINSGWAQLDAEVDAILATGAKPFLALSYLPGGWGSDVTAMPDLNRWYGLVKATIEHYSGRNAKNIDGVYYEVWNEPDLFGGFKTYGDKNYLDLYRASSRAAVDAINVQPFRFGGPATTGAYRNWIEALINLVDQENLRLDFISWHRYSWDDEAIAADTETINQLLAPYPRLALIEKLVTEYGPDPKNHSAYDDHLGAAHLFATIKSSLGKIHKIFNFEIMDGPDPAGKALWGRYGLLTYSATGLLTKPRYDLFIWLNQLSGQRLALRGEGSWVKALAVANGPDIQVYLINYDPHGNHSEAVPLVINNLAPGNYQVASEWFKGKTLNKTIIINSGTFIDQFLLKPNDIVRISLTH